MIEGKKGRVAEAGEEINKTLKTILADHLSNIEYPLQNYREPLIVSKYRHKMNANERKAKKMVGTTLLRRPFKTANKNNNNYYKLHVFFF